MHRGRKRSQQGRRRAFAVVAAGAVVWVLLYLLGRAGVWTSLVLVVAVGLLMLLTELGGQGRPTRSRRHPRPHGLAVGEDELPITPPSSHRPNAVADEYNTLVDSSPIAPSPIPFPEQRLIRAIPSNSGAEQGSRMPPPVPPPLFGRPGSRPIVAGFEHTVRKRDSEGEAPLTRVAPLAVEETAAEEALPAAVATSPVEEPPADEVFPATAAPSPVEEPPAEEVFPTAAVHPAMEVSTPPSVPPPATAPPAAAPPVTAHPVQRQAAPSYRLPSFEMLPMPETERGLSDDEILERASLLEQTLSSFGVEAKVVDFAFGPAVTRYELQPAPGVRVNKFTALTDDLALALAAVDVRVEAPIPGKSAVGIEVPNKERLAVPLREVLQSPQFRQNPSRLAVSFGKDNAGQPVVGDLARMPHLLIAGSTGSGKSVCMNSIICSLLFKARPDEVKMLMIDPKMVELSIYSGIPHLTAPVITDARKAAGYLKGAVKEMETRYELFAALGVRNIAHYNQLVAADPGPDPAHPRQPLPYIVIFIDELADLMMVAAAEVEDSICRLAQMARACGMHLVIATQSPRVDVITGLIKANVPSRIAFAVSSQVDSRVILDSAGAERLLGRGDMLYHPSGLPKPLRAQGAFIDEASVEELVRFVKSQGEPEFTAQEVSVEANGRRNGRGAAEEPQPASAVDEALPEAVRVVIEHGQASVSLLQRRLRCNYTKATRLIDLMEELGLIGPHQGSRPREVLASMAQWQELFGADLDEGDDFDDR